MSEELTYNVVEAIKERRSVRTYQETPVDNDLVGKIMQYASSVENPFGVEVKIAKVDSRVAVEGEKLGTYGVIKGASTFLGVSVPDVKDARLAAGFSFEDVVLYATSLNLGTVWIAGTLTRSRFQRAMGFADDWIFPAISAVGYPEKKRMMERLMRKAVGADNRKPWSAVFFNEDFDSPLSADAAGNYATALEMVRLAPSAVNAQPWRIVRQGDCFHFYAMYKEGAKPADVAIKHVDMGIAMCHFSLTLRQEGVEGCYFDCDPANVKAPATYHYIKSWRPER